MSGLPGFAPPGLGEIGGPEEEGDLGTLPDPVAIQIPTAVSLLARIWKLAPGAAIGIVKGSTNGGRANESTDTKILIRLADVTDTEIELHHQGTFFLPPLVVPMIPPAASEGGG